MTNGRGSAQDNHSAGSGTALSNLPRLPQDCECLDEAYRRKVREVGLVQIFDSFSDMGVGRVILVLVFKFCHFLVIIGWNWAGCERVF